jgi:hypothetical protein
VGGGFCELIWSNPLQSSNASRDKVEKFRVVGAPLIFVIALNVLRKIHCCLCEFAVWVLLAAQIALLKNPAPDIPEKARRKQINSGPDRGRGSYGLWVHPFRLSQYI